MIGAVTSSNTLTRPIGAPGAELAEGVADIVQQSAHPGAGDRDRVGLLHPQPQFLLAHGDPLRRICEPDPTQVTGFLVLVQ